MKAKKGGKSIFVVIFVIVLLLMVATSLTTSIIFSGEDIPKIGKYYLYMHDAADMEPDIPQNSLVVAEEATVGSLTPGNKVLCYLSDNKLALRVIYQITLNDDETVSYYPGTALDQGSELTIPRQNIFAICTWQNEALYHYVDFATNVSGIMLLLVLPCIVLIIMILVKIQKSSKDELDDDDFLFDEEPVLPKAKRLSDNPLFDPGSTPASGESFERKKSSISENFERKPVNENSPYQKAVQERTMKFRIDQQMMEDAKRQDASVSKTSGTQVFSTQAVEEVAKHQTGSFSVTEAAEKSEQYTAAPTEPVKPAVRPEPVRTSTTPNIDDIVKPSELRAAKTGQRINPNIAATDSIDDLLRVLEAEKKKL